MKDQLKDYIFNLIEKGVSEEIDPLQSYIELKEFSNLIDAGLKDIQSKAVNEAYKHNAKTFKIYGAEVTVKSSAGRWDFSGIKEVSNFENDLKAIKEAHKEAYKMSLKGQEIVQDGVLIEPAKFTAGKDIINIKL